MLLSSETVPASLRRIFGMALASAVASCSQASPDVAKDGGAEARAGDAALRDAVADDVHEAGMRDT
jgi:hypothetical protein